VKKILLFVLCTLKLLSNPKDAYSMAVTEGEPSSLVEGMVSAITGDLYIEQSDVVIQGYVPLILPRFYLSGDGKGNRAGWSFFEHLVAEYRSSQNEHLITVQDAHQTAVVFYAPASEIVDKYEKRVKRKKHHVSTIKFHPPALSTLPGVTNTAQGEIGARTNLKNASIKMEPDGSYFSLYCPDGTVRCYRAVHHQKHFDDIFLGHAYKTLEYLLQWEKLPTGSMIFYGYDSCNRVNVIRTANLNNTKTYAQATFHYHHENGDKNANFDITTSDGRTLNYRYEKLHKDHRVFLLKNIAGPESPPEDIGYHAEQDHTGPLLSRRSFPGYRYFDIDYYRKKDNHFEGHYVKLHSDDPRVRRVRTLKAPVGSDYHPLLTHKFFYAPEQRKTEVYTVDNCKTEFYYTPEMRLSAIYRYGASGPWVNCEGFLWSPEGDILVRNFYENGKCLLSRRFIYDIRGNVIEERLGGNLSGHPNVPLTIGADGYPLANGSETFITKRLYSQDERDLVIRKEESSGKVSLYTYLPGTTLPTSELVCEKAHVQSRHFYEYNHDLVLVREITDDGSSSDCADLSDVKVRKIRDVVPMPSGPYIDMPHVILEKYWEDGKEVLLNKTVLTYTTGGKVSRKDVYNAQDQLCYTLRFVYDAYGRLVEETNPLGQTARYTYDAVGNKTSVQEFGSDVLSHMEYDYSNRLVLEQDPGKRVTLHRYDLKHNKVASVDPYGNETRYTYDPFGNLTQIKLPTVLNPDGKPIQPSGSSSYDAAGREISHTDALGRTTRKQYNTRSQVALICHPDGTEEKFLYNSDGTLSSHTDPEGVVTTHTYDILGRKTSTTKDSRCETYLYDRSLLISKTDASGLVTQYTYDSAGRKITEECAGEKIEYSYDALGRLFRTQSGGIITALEYDLLDRVVEERKENSAGTLFHRVSYTYDKMGNQSSITRNICGTDATERFEYDSRRRLITKIDPLGNRTQIAYIEDHLNALGQKVLQKITVDPMGTRKIETHDALNRLVSVETLNAQGERRALEEMFYDAASNLCRQVSTVFPFMRQVTTLRQYDARNRLTALIEAAGTPEEKITRTLYTRDGLKSQVIKPDGITLSYTYDPLGNLQTITSSDNTISYVCQYDKMGRLLSAQDTLTGLETARILDARGRLLTEKLANGLCLQNQYDFQGRRTELVLPDSSSISYVYDPYSLREVQRKDVSGFTLYTHLYSEYDLAGYLQTSEMICGLGSITYHINTSGQTDSIRSPYLVHTADQFDAAGNLLHSTRNETTSRYSYDDLYQITSEEGVFSHTYQNDSHYNRLSKDTQEYLVNALNQLSTLSYDQNGNPKAQAGLRYAYDALDRLISIESDTLKCLFSYDFFNRRLSKTTLVLQDGRWQTADVIHFLYDGQMEVGAVDASHQLVELRVLGLTPRAEIGAAVALELRGRLFAPVHDLFGNLACLVSREGSIAESYLYDAFGEEVAPSSLCNPWRFSSKRVDPESGLIYYGRRYYDPGLGRWLTPDPIGFADGMNLYAFVRNNPLTHIDLYGLASASGSYYMPSDKVWDYRNPIPPRYVEYPKICALPSTPSPSVRSSGVIEFVSDPPILFRTLTGGKAFFNPKPRKFHLNRPEHSHNRITWANGIANKFSDSHASAMRISDIAGGYNVHGMYNSSEGVFMDLAGTAAEVLGIPSKESFMLRSLLIGLYKQLPEGGIIIHTAHSRGNVQSLTALKTLPSEVRSKIHMISIASPVVIPQDLCSDVVHFASKNDPVTVYVRSQAKSNPKIKVLDPHPQANKWMDHAFLSPTYQEKLEPELIEKMKLYENCQ